jgi:hydroxyacyl-ACP dehydratase HTD2-like protein with hotdog domain
VVATDLEPLHHVILENKYVTVMRVLIQPGQSTLFHEQHLDYVNTHIAGSSVKIEYQAG